MGGFLLIRFAEILAPVGVLLLVVGLASLLGYGLFHALDGGIALDALISKIAKGLLVLSLWPLSRWLKMDWAALGFAGWRSFCRQLARGLALGLVTLFPIIALLVVLGVQLPDPDVQDSLYWLAQKIAVSLLLAVLISVAEEPVFRGLLLSGLRRKHSLAVAILVSATYYALLHFLKTDLTLAAEDVHWYSGFILFLDAFDHLLRVEIISPFLALVAVGVFLGLARVIWPGGLGLCIGCHTAWVWQIKLTKTFYDVDAGADYYFLVSAYDGVIGPLVTVWLALASGFLVWRYWGRLVKV